MSANAHALAEDTRSVTVPFQAASLDIWDKKYRLKDLRGDPVDDDVDATFRRVARALADVETPDKREHWYERFLWALRHGAIPAGRIISNAGGQAYKPATSTINCTVSGTVRDSMDGILEKVHEAGLTLKAGCVAPGTWVYTEQGRVTAEQAVAEQHERMLCYDRDNARYEYRPIQRHLTTHVPRDEQIELVSNGASLKTSIKHPVLVYRNGRLLYVRADEVGESDALVHRSLPWRADGERVLEAWFAGAHLGDGSAYKKHKEYSPARSRWKERAEAWGSRLVFKIRAAEQAVVERYATFFYSFCNAQARVMPAETVNGTQVWDYQVASFEASQAADLIDGQVGKKTAGLRVPAWVARHPENHFLPFLAGLVDTDGTVSLERGSVTIATQSHDFAEEIRDLLGLFGIHAGLTRCKPRTHNYAGHEVRDAGGAMLKISDSAFLLRVADHLADPGKRDRIHHFASQAGQYDRYVLPHSLKEALAEAADGLDHRQRQHLGFYHGYHRGDVVSRVWLDRWEANLPELKPLIEFARTLHPLEDIRRNLDLPETFYDFEVAEHHNYVAGNGGLMVIHNCGIGYDFSTLRPRGAFVAGAGAITSGPLSFMDIFDRMCFTISSAGGRRGAQMATFDVGHPDVQDFIRAKREDGRLRQFNMSLLASHEFMEAVKSDDWWRLAFPVTNKQAEVEEIDLSDPEQVVWRDWPNRDQTDYIVGDDGRVACKVFRTIKARHLWNAIMSSTYDYAEPGFILIDQYNDMNNNWYVENIRATNPCVTGDTRIHTDRGEVPIQEVAGETLQVWNGFEWSQVIPKVTGHDRNILRIRFEAGEYLDCTLNHKFVLEDGRRVDAQELAVGDKLQAFSLPLALSGTGGTADTLARSGPRVVSMEAIGVADTVYCVTEPKNHTAVFNGVMTGNCGEQGLPPYGACLLGSVNLTQFVRNPFSEDAYFDWDAYREVVAVFTRMLDNVVEISGLPLDEQQHEIERKRRHGMGFLGLGSTLAMLRMTYGDPPSVDFTEQVSRELAETGWRTAAELAREKGAAPIMDETFSVDEEMLRLRPEMASDGYQVGDSVPGRILMARYSRYMQQFPEAITDAIAEHGARFTHHSSIAPTGTISLSLANNASNGIEPSFAHKYFRNVIRDGKKSKEKVEVDSYELLAYKHLKDPDGDPEAGGEHALPDYFVDTNSIQPWQHVEIQAAAQKWIDSSISKTINVPQDFDFDAFKDIYLYAYDKGLKGCTTFRFNPEAFQGVLVQDKDLKNTTYRFELDDGSVVEARGDEEIEYDGELHNAANLFDALKEGYYGRF